MRHFRRVLTSAQSSVNHPYSGLQRPFPWEQFVCHSRGLYSLLLPGQCHKYSPPKRYDALNEINHSLRGIIGLAQSSISSRIIRSYIVASSGMTRCTCRSRERRWLRAICLGGRSLARIACSSWSSFPFAFHSGRLRDRS